MLLATFVSLSQRKKTLHSSRPVTQTEVRGDGPELPDMCKGPVGLPQADPVEGFDLFRLGPFPFFNNFRNPCWYEENSSFGMSCLPYFYLAGLPKCGTTDLWNRICMHPDVAPTFPKETGWLTKFRFLKKQFGIGQYAQFFASAIRRYGRSPERMRSLVVGKI
ncbi:hypothetical protein BaRGS_00025768 [Batillaria attramentaria]|uniref:Sulfotransferase n=1 Tax=Batillaria attramentaria TaxID=370345 RepID=A0ABD0K6L9_9CAEN